MRNTFRYSLTLDDYIKFYQMQYKRSLLPKYVLLWSIFIMFALYYSFVNKNIYFVIGTVFAVIITIPFVIYQLKKGAFKKEVDLIKGIPSYFKQTEITITDKTIETNNLPDLNEAGIIAVYPYSIMNVIYETNDYFYFVIGAEAKILPKSAIPNEMKKWVFEEIKKNPNCVFVK